jgi:alpha,alpha-trehalose-phosphate synthase [UDP-forming]
MRQKLMKVDSKKRLVVVSNRLPLAIFKEGEEWRVRGGEGGLVTALHPVMKKNQGLWVGWPGCGEEAPYEELLDEFSDREGFELKAVPLSEEEMEKYYWGFSNQSLWPLFHDLLGHCHFSLEQWQTYLKVNERFAGVVASTALENDLVWVHDYQLIMVGEALRQLGLRQTLGFFLHIPFPSVDLFWRLPWKRKILEGLLEYDLVGFQTTRDWRNFVNCALTLVPGVEVEVRRRNYTILTIDGRTMKAGHFPISIDYAGFNDGAQSSEVADEAVLLKKNYPDQMLVLGLDRLDYSKGIPERFLAFERLLEKYPQLREKITLLQVVVPSRTLLPDYQDLKETLDQMAGRINSRFSAGGWTPIHYFFRSLDRIQLLAHYRACEIALITPLRDGMNLVAKEFCAGSVDLDSVLILSEFAGAAEQLASNALLVNPFDVDGMADAIYVACRMDSEEKKQRMFRLRFSIQRNDVHRWLSKFVAQMEKCP